MNAPYIADLLRHTYSLRKSGRFWIISKAGRELGSADTEKAALLQLDFFIRADLMGVKHATTLLRRLGFTVIPPSRTRPIAKRPARVKAS